jgi:hypothetical protein
MQVCLFYDVEFTENAVGYANTEAGVGPAARRVQSPTAAPAAWADGNFAAKISLVASPQSGTVIVVESNMGLQTSLLQP